MEEDEEAWLDTDDPDPDPGTDPEPLLPLVLTAVPLRMAAVCMLPDLATVLAEVAAALVLPSLAMG